MNMAAGLTLIVTYFPRQTLMEMGKKGLKIFLGTYSGQYQDGTMFKAIHPIEVTQEGVSGLSLRKVILKRNIALTSEQMELLKLHRRVIIRGDFISVE